MTRRIQKRPGSKIDNDMIYLYCLMNLFNYKIIFIKICLIKQFFQSFSTVEDRNANHFPQLLDLDISYNRLDCNCTIEQIIASHSNIAQSLLENANIFCKNKEIMYKEETSSSSYYINFVGPSGRYDKELEVKILLT